MPQPETNPMQDRPLDAYRPAAHVRASHAEGSFTRLVEEQTAKVPSSVFLTLAVGAMTASAVLEIVGRRRMSRFIGMWPSTLLTMGVYNKLVKTLGPA